MQGIDSPPTDPMGVAFAERLRAIERGGAGWEELFAALDAVSVRLARRFPYVATLDEVNALMMEETYERHVRNFLNAVDRGDRGIRFKTYVFERLWNQLANHHRTKRRRLKADEEQGAHAGGVCRDPYASPDADARFREYIASIESREGAHALDGDIAACLAAGWSQREIAAELEMSEATISRRVEAIRMFLSRSEK